MKALPMLDHVMLWVARVFAVCVLLLFVFTLSQELSEPSVDFGSPSLFVELTTSILVVTYLASFWILNLIARLFLGGMSALGFYYLAFGFAESLTHYYENPRFYWDNPSFGENFALMLTIIFLMLCGTVSAMWVSVRPAKPPLFRFRRINLPFANPVSLVNPV